MLCAKFNKHRLFSFLAIGAAHMIRHIIGVVIWVVGIAFARPRFFVLRAGIAFDQVAFDCRRPVSGPLANRYNISASRFPLRITCARAFANPIF